MIQMTSDQILQRLLDNLRANTQIVDVDPGSIVRSFSEIMSEEFGDFYTELDLNTTMNFVSTATGQFLDLIGTLLACVRITGESDGDFRSRITNQVYVIAGGNLTAIRLKVLSIDGILDVVAREFTKGTGSFSLYIITDNPVISQSLINQAQDAVDLAKSLGVLGEVKAPTLIPIVLKIRLIFSDKVSDAEKTSLRQSAKQAVKTYIDNLGLGGSLSINDILSNIRVSNKIVDAEIMLLKISGISQFAKNFTVNWDERIVIDTLDIV